MPRRATYTDLIKINRVVPANSRGNGDIAFKGFQCPTPGCSRWLFYHAAAFSGEYTISCDECRESYGPGDSIKLYDYELTDRESSSVIEAGTMELVVEDYIHEAALFKYCIVCYTLKPFEAFGHHAARQTGRQGECRLCKTQYNAAKNQTRIADQFTEAAQKRRLLVFLGGSTRISQTMIRRRYDNKCFKCGKDVSAEGAAQFDHTLPVRYFWPMTTENATLLCAEHNGAKGASWPSEFYTDGELRTLALKTGISYDLLRGEPTVNPDALVRLRDGAVVDELVVKFAHYMDEVFLIRNRILDLTAFDFFESSANISQVWKDRANELRPTQSATTSE